MTDMIQNDAAQSGAAADALRLSVHESPALAAFIAERAAATGSIGRLMRAANGMIASAEGIQAPAPAATGWQSGLARVIASPIPVPTPQIVAEILPLIQESSAEGTYPWFGALRFVPEAGDPAAIDALADALVRATGLGAALGTWLEQFDTPASRKIEGAVLRAGLNHGSKEPSLLAAALDIAIRNASPETAIEIAERIVRLLPRGDVRRVVALRCIAEVAGTFRATEIAQNYTAEGCAAATLFAAGEALRQGRLGAALQLLEDAETDSTVILRHVETLRQRIGLRLAQDRLSFATTAARMGAAEELGRRLVAAAANEDIETAEWWPAALTLAEHAIEAADLAAFDPLAGLLRDNQSLVRQMAHHLIQREKPAFDALTPFDPPELVAALIAEAGIHRRLGRPEAALIHYRLAAATLALEEPLRLEVAYTALALGRIDEAFEWAEPLSRLYPQDLAKVSWPADGIGRPWPHAPLLDSASVPAPPAGKKWPRISVVVPSFNQVKYARECLQSLVLQNYPDLEVIVYDAVSTDGTIAVLEEYRDKVASLIIEPDKGQSDAINKGLARATGDLLHWLNTDDILAPGACYAVARRYLETEADIIAGACVEFSDREMRLLNLPSATAEDFTVEELCKQFDRWLKGNFFYQPEVFFSKRIWDLAGGRLDPSHHLAMDFDLWVRAARAGARYERVHWPTAFFRKHAEQKTSQLEDTIDEQAKIVNLAIPQVPEPARRAEIDRRRALGRGRRRRIAVVTKRYGKIFSESVEADLRTDLADLSDVALFRSPHDVEANSFDHIIQLCHVQQDFDDIAGYRSRGFQGAVTAWFWDNHHNYWENRRTAEAADLVVPGHAFCADYLTNREALMMSPVPLCVTQWGRAEARALFADFGDTDRSDALSGGFVDYRMSNKRSRLVTDLVAAGASNALLLLRESDLSPYFGLSPAQRFAGWCSYKTSLCLPLRRDLSQRFFDAWLTGQVVVVPEETADLISVLPEDQRRRHMVTFRKWTVEDVMAAQERALRLFDEGGIDGVRERHELAASRHMFADRIRTLIDQS